MDFSPGQQRAMESVRAWLESPNGKQVFRLFGYAGTGKTTLAKHLAEDAGKTLFAAYTGKAALVLRQRGCHGASTIHRLIYTPLDKSRLRLQELERDLLSARARVNPETGDGLALVEKIEREIEKERANLKRPSFQLNLDSDLSKVDLLCVDEVSMVGNQIGKDLESFGTKILVLGDTAQLPPVKDGGYFTNIEPDILLTEIHRQAAGSPVIQLATTVREGGSLEQGEYGESRVVAKGSIPFEEAAEYDQVLVGRNATRIKFNRSFRANVLDRKDHLPVLGDKLVCLRNDHEQGLLNGGLWTVQGRDTLDNDQMVLDLTNEEGQVVETIAHRHPFEDREIPPWEYREATQFDYGYALTVHKAQGSQWGSVLLVDEGHCFGGSARRWRYTGLTRAAERVTVVQQ